MSKRKEKINYISGLMSLIFSLLLSSLILFAISKNFTFTLDISKAADLFTVDLRLFAPEPMERTLFITGMILMPILLLIFYGVFIKLMSYIENLTVLNKVYNALYSGIIVLILFLGYIGIKRNTYIYSLHNISINSINLTILGMATLLFYLIVVNPGKKEKKDSLALLLQSALNLLSLLLIFSIFLLCIFSINSVTDSTIFTESFNAVFHAVVQVYMGKELLVDLTHQYGLYPHFIEPVFKVFGLSVLSFTLLMGALMGLSLFLIVQFLKDITSDRIIGSLGFIVMVYYNYFFAKLTWLHDFTFQYFPIRFLFPALSIYLVYNYFQKKTKTLYYFSFITYSIAVLWNFDTGFVVFASWLLSLLFQELFRLDFKKMIGHVLNGILIFSGIILLFTAYMFVRYGYIPEYAGFFTYQKVFYLYGFGMFPMPILHPWNLVILTYVIGLLYSFSFLMEKNESIKAKMVFYLSILGVGVFSYYQGRSHDLNLLHVCYPAIIILTILTDCLLQRIREGGGYNDKSAFAAIIFLMLFSVASIVGNYPVILRMIMTQINDIGSGNPKNVAQNAVFIKKNTEKGEQVFIMSAHSGIYYLESGAISPLRIPSIIEIFLLEDEQKMIASLTNNSLIGKIIIDRTTYARFNDTLVKYLKNNFSINVSPNREVAIFIRK